MATQAATRHACSVEKRTTRRTEDEGRKRSNTGAAGCPPYGHTLSVFSSFLSSPYYPLVPRIHAVVHRRFDPLINIAHTGTRRGTRIRRRSSLFFLSYVTTAGSSPEQHTESIVADLDPQALLLDPVISRVDITYKKKRRGKKSRYERITKSRISSSPDSSRSSGPSGIRVAPGTRPIL